MFRSLTILILMAGCATVPSAGSSENGAPVEVVGHVTSSCAAPAEKSVTLRAAGEIEPLETTKTDASGAFKFSVAPKFDPKATIFIEADGHKAVARPQSNAKNLLVAELTLPCER
ncbi:MAG: hypothetical protein QM723_10690 [Myxococcaceae bacterium]